MFTAPVLRVDPAQQPRLEEIRSNLADRIAEGLRVSLAAAEGELSQLAEHRRRAAITNLGIPIFREIASRTTALPARGRASTV
ncbi:hypothetical protein [Streptomyces klenkii]|uniref:hypothetical protein n=1 Tax=Streptomyces klenkii TaxID=1420899 RepID=UPI00341CAD2C